MTRRKANSAETIRVVPRTAQESNPQSITVCLALSYVLPSAICVAEERKSSSSDQSLSAHYYSPAISYSGYKLSRNQKEREKEREKEKEREREISSNQNGEEDRD